jgi:hypothetical protein
MDPLNARPKSSGTPVCAKSMFIPARGSRVASLASSRELQTRMLCADFALFDQDSTRRNPRWRYDGRPAHDTSINTGRPHRCRVPRLRRSLDTRAEELVVAVGMDVMSLRHPHRIGAARKAAVAGRRRTTQDLGWGLRPPHSTFTDPANLPLRRAACPNKNEREVLLEGAVTCTPGRRRKNLPPTALELSATP